MGEDFRRLLAFANERVDIRLQRGAISKDLFYHIADEGGVTGRNTTQEELVQDAQLAIVAGADTTSSVLANLFYSIISNPDVLTTLKNEVDATFSEDEDTLDVGKLQTMPYLNACMCVILAFYFHRTELGVKPATRLYGFSLLFLRALVVRQSKVVDRCL
jgi:cytochrome P450